MKSGMRRRGVTLRWRTATVCLLLALGFAANGCNDPYSRSRIARREERLRAFGEGVQASEEARGRRRRESVETFNQWWEQDRDQFNRRWPTVGDYIW